MDNMFNSDQNQQLQLRDEEDGADTWFKDINNWVFEFKYKIYNWLRQAEKGSAKILPPPSLPSQRTTQKFKKLSISQLKKQS